VSNANVYSVVNMSRSGKRSFCQKEPFSICLRKTIKSWSSRS